MAVNLPAATISNADPAILGSGEHRYRVVENWAKLPKRWKLSDVASVAVDSKDRIYVFNRGAHPMVVFDRAGNFHSDELHLTERFTPITKDAINYEVTIDDPVTLEHPYSYKRFYEWRPDVRPAAYICEENNRNKPDASGKLRHGEGGRLAVQGKGN